MQINNKNLLFIGLFIASLSLYFHFHEGRQELIRNNRGTAVLGELTPSTADYLKKSISIDYPDVDIKDIDDLEKVNLLRKWASERIPWATGSMQIKNIIQGKKATSIFDFFENGKGGVDCGGAAYSLMKLYKLYGYSSYEYHFGDKDDWNHAITLVKINHKGKRLLVMEDAYFNTTYVYLSEEPIDFFDFLRMVGNGEKSKIILIKDGDGQHLNINNIDGKITKYLSETNYYYLDGNYTAYLIPRFLQSANDGEGTDAMMKKIQSLVVY